MSERADPHLLVVGIDAGCLPVLRPLFDRGEVPTLRRLIEGGASGPLESQIPPWTGSAWPSIYTGKNPGKHGVFDFLAFDGYEWDVVNATRVRERAIWEPGRTTCSTGRKRATASPDQVCCNGRWRSPRGSA